jgi:hypothetical protein
LILVVEFYKNIMKKLICCFLIVSSTAALAQQQNPTIDLKDLSAFKSQAGNWQIVGDVQMDPEIDVHQKPAHLPVNDPKGKKKKNKEKVTVPEARKAVTATAGTGILLNDNDDKRRDALVTNFEHGDIELEFDVMLPKGSNSGVYLQGRYEVQLLDSWGIKHPAFSDIGGIFRNWETMPEKIYMGKAPLSNAAKAPGLWQRMKIAFRAPRFDSNGVKIANARFLLVQLNGVKIHDNVEVPHPTGGPLENNEKPTGPLMIQGDHGPVAFRNFKIKLMKELDVKLSDIKYKTYYGPFRSIADFISQKPATSGSMEQLSVEVLEKENAYGAVYSGIITVPEKADYRIVTSVTGGTKLIVNDQELLNVQRADAWLSDTANITLDAGSYPFEIQNFKDASWMPPQLGLYIFTASMYPKPLHAYNSLPPPEDPVAPIFISAGQEPKLLRAFLDFKGKRRQRLTHTIGVGDPSGVNYVYDLSTGNVVCMWRGGFVDATPMWHDRGDGSFKPMGAAQFTFVNQPLSYLTDNNASFPSIRNENDLTPKGYLIDVKTNLPTFKYLYRGLEVQDKISPSDESRSLQREISIKGAPEPNLYFKLAEGTSIQAMSDGRYAVNDRSYYIKLDPATEASVRDVNGRKELIVAVKNNIIKYSIIW